MPGPRHQSPRRPGPRPDRNGNPRVPNRKQAKRLAARIASAPVGDGFTTPGSQNRAK